MESTWLIALVPLFVALNAFFVAIEFALVTVRWTRVEALVEANMPGSKLVQRAVENLNDSLAASQLGITFTSLALGWVGEPALAHLFEPWFHGLPPVQGFVLTHGLAVALAFLCITYLHIVLGELVPRAIAIQHAERTALLLAGPLLAFRGVSRPLVMIMKGSGNRVIQWLRVPEPPAEQQVHSVDELDMLVEEGEEAGVIPTYQASYVRNVFELSDKTVADVMVPRVDIVAIAADTPLDEVVRLIQSEAHSRYPIYRESLDDVIGMIHIKDVLAYWGTAKKFNLRDILRRVVFVAPTLPVLDMLLDMRRSRTHMALVVDEFGGTDGLLTIEDLVEEIVGEIEDEHDVAQTPTVARRVDGTIDVNGRTPIELLEEEIGRVLSDDERREIDTVGGLIFSLLGRIPERGEVVRHPSGVEFEILDVDPRRIRRLRVRPPTQSAPVA